MVKEEENFTDQEEEIMETFISMFMEPRREPLEIIHESSEEPISQEPLEEEEEEEPIQETSEEEKDEEEEKEEPRREPHVEEPIRQEPTQVSHEQPILEPFVEEEDDKEEKEEEQLITRRRRVPEIEEIPDDEPIQEPRGEDEGTVKEEQEPLKEHSTKVTMSTTKVTSLPSAGAGGSSSADMVIHPLGYYNVDPHSSSSWIKSPLHPIYRYWRGFMLLLVTYSAWAYPFEVAFLKTSSKYPLTNLYIFDVLVDICFFVNLLLTFFVGFFEPTTHLLILKPLDITERYLSTWFLIDLASILPHELVIYFVTGKHTMLIISVLSSLRLLRLRHIEQFFTRLEKDIRFSYFWVRLAKLVCVALYFVYIGGCAYYYLAVVNPFQERSWRHSINQNEGNKSLLGWLVSAIYWSMTTFSTVGYGDVHPENESEKVFSVIYMICAAIAFIYFSANMNDLFLESKRPIMELRKDIDNMAMLANRNQLPLRLKQRILAYMCLSFEAKSLNQEQAIEQLPVTLQNTIRQSLYLPTVEKVYLFSGIDTKTSLLLAARMRGEYIPPREDVIVKNEDSQYVYIIQSGEVELVNTDEEGKEQVLDVLSSNDIFGEVGAIRDRPESYTYRTRALTQVFRLKKKTLMRAMQDNQRILCNFEQRHRELGDSNGKAPLEAEVGHGIRVSIYKGHPNEISDSEGAVIALPSSMKDLRRIAGDAHRFDASEAVIRNEDGDRIISIGVIRDNDKLFIGS